MSRLVGETVILRTTTGGGVDDDGYPLPDIKVDTPVTRAVFIPESGDIYRTADRDVVVQAASVLLPYVLEVPPTATVIVRGVEYRQSKPAADHKSMFGTGRGGTEIFLTKGTG